jgi:lipopolysaccharide export system protein LptA
MSRQLFISKLFYLSGALIIFLLLSLNAFSAEKAERIKGPIIITSEILTADNQTHTALFENSVVARTTDMTIYADRMLVYYNKDTGNVIRINAEGDVKLIKENRVITSKEATYYAEGEKVIFSGEPRAVDGENVVTGRKMTYLLNEDRFLVEGSKVFLKNKGQ